MEWAYFSAFSVHLDKVSTTYSDLGSSDIYYMDQVAPLNYYIGLDLHLLNLMRAD